MEKKRYLTQKEIENILDFLKPSRGIPLEASLSVIKLNKKLFREQLVSQEIYPSLIPKLKENIKTQYYQSLIQAGENIGIIGAQGIGEKQTQKTLNTFHQAGKSDKTVTVGVPRVEELLNATREPKSVNCIVKMKDYHNSISELRNTIGCQVLEIKLEKITVSWDIIINKKPEKWYLPFQILYNDDFTKYKDCISLKLNRDLLFEYQLDVETIANKIQDTFEDIKCVFSPDNIYQTKILQKLTDRKFTPEMKNFGESDYPDPIPIVQFDIFVDTSSIELPQSRILYIDQENKNQIYLEEVVQPILFNFLIAGISGIENIYFNDDHNSFDTDGSNFKELLSLSFVDYTETVSNNIWDIYENLGIEATRQFLIDEFMTIMEGINECHVKLLVEKMTFSGSISSVSRYSMRNEESGPIGKASFEETMDNFIKAAIYAQEDNIKGVSASIICGNTPKIGSGLCEIMMNTPLIISTPSILQDEIKENYY
jgi:DNA-directed RNA polymerase beta' subunit